MVFSTRFFIQKYPKVTGVKKTIMSIWTNCFVHVQHDEASKLDLVILTGEVTNKMTHYMIS
jgi:hypothetical protein